MSGCSFDFIYSTFSSALGIPAGNYDAIKTDMLENKAYKEVSRINPMRDVELSMLMYDVSCLLQAAEWSASGDISCEKYKEIKALFKDKWFNKTDEQKSKECKELIEEYVRELKTDYFGE